MRMYVNVGRLALYLGLAFASYVGEMKWWVVAAIIWYDAVNVMLYFNIPWFKPKAQPLPHMDLRAFERYIEPQEGEDPQ